MDLRSLINKLDSIEQRKLLQESEQLMEKVRIRYSDVEAVAKQYPTDEVARGQALAKLAKDNGLPGLFDPVSRELVNPDGSLSTFKGADQATVDQLKQWGLLPLGAKTSSWLGFRGEDEKTAMGDNQSAQSRDAMVDKAEALMKKAVEVAAKAVTPASTTPASTTKAGQASESTMFTSGIASALMEEFGYNGVALLESITPEEHTELKGIITKLTPFAKNDPDVTDIVAQFRAYNQQRDQIIKRIMELIQVIKSKPVAKSPTPVKESLQESKTRMLSEGRVQILEEGKRYLRDGIEWTYDPSTKLYSHLNEDGTVDQLDEEGFWQGAGDFARGAAQGLTAGYADNISAGVQALFTNKTYKDALKAELAKTKTAQERSPWLYYGGAGLGFVANPLSKIGWGIPFMAATFASDKLVREPWNDAVLGKDGKPQNTNQGGMSDSIKAMQDEILKRDPKALPRFGADGKMGKETQAALAKYPDIAAKYKQQAASAPATANVMPAAPAVSVSPEKAKQFLDQIKQLAKQNGISDAEAATLVPELKESIQLDENVLLRGALEWLLKSGTDAGGKAVADATKAGAEAILKTGGNEVAKIGQAFTDAQGTTWTKMSGYWSPVSGPLKGARNQVGIRSQPEMFAKLEAEFAAKMGVETGAKGAVEAGAKGTLEPAAEAVASRFGPTARSAIEKLQAGGGSVLRFIKNNKFLTAVAILATAGYMFNSDGNIVDDHGGGGGGGGGSGGGTTNTQGGMNEVSPEMTELQKLVDQLAGGWPTDAETASALAAAKEAGAKVPEVTANQSGMAVTGSSASSSDASSTGRVSSFASGADTRTSMNAERTAREAGKKQ